MHFSASARALRRTAASSLRPSGLGERPFGNAMSRLIALLNAMMRAMICGYNILMLCARIHKNVREFVGSAT
jgi:hypothetical protein